MPSSSVGLPPSATSLLRHEPAVEGDWGPDDDEPTREDLDDADIIEHGENGLGVADEDPDAEASPLLAAELPDMTVEERQEALNEEHPFGIAIWKPALYPKRRTIDYEAEEDVHAEPPATADDARPLKTSFPNLLWSLTLGWPLALVFLVAGSMLSMFGGRSVERAALLKSMAGYVLSPFGLYLVRLRRTAGATLEGRSPTVAVDSPLLGPGNADFPPSDVAGFRALLSLVVFPFVALAAGLCWLLVLPIPMARFLYYLTLELWRNPDDVQVRAPGYQTASSSETNRLSDTVIFVRTATSSSLGPQSEDIVLSVRRSFGFRYVKYTVSGVNVIVVNSILLPLLTLVLSFVPSVPESVMFGLALCSVVPCGYFIGASVSSITSQTGNLALGAILNATFGSIVEILIYLVMIRQGDKRKLVEGSLVGSFLFGMLCLPGLAMLAGGLRKRSLAFNVRATGVTVTLLITAVIGVFIPTLFHNTFAPWDVYCASCSAGSPSDPSAPGSSPCEMRGCWMKQATGASSPLLAGRTRPLAYFCSFALVLTYGVGLAYTLFTHQNHIYKKGTKKGAAKKKAAKKPSTSAPRSGSPRSSPRPNFVSPAFQPKHLRPRPPDSPLIVGDPRRRPPMIDTTPPPLPDPGPPSTDSAVSDQGHHGPGWGTARAVGVLLAATVVFALVAEVLVDNVGAIVESGGMPWLDQKMLGLTLFAIVPSITEVFNSVAFALAGRMQLAMEIANQYTAQVALLQIPLIVAASAILDYRAGRPPGEGGLSLVFPLWDAFSIFLSVMLVSYVFVEGRSSYFKGAILVVTYLMLIVSLGFVPPALEDRTRDLPHGARLVIVQ
ncbi:hypothetical protein DFJ74DRAFT_312814 [Hyaloraphidium curvatum]|nr:hypothetical protein DFJ74DRAFT_312814 [Hyaloraphidium curvatum]